MKIKFLESPTANEFDEEFSWSYTFYIPIIRYGAELKPLASFYID